MEWEWLNVIGILAFASSGALVAMEEGYDLLGVLFLGFAASFGGGILRNILLGVPASAVWSQGTLFAVALAVILVVFCLPREAIIRWQRPVIFLDAIGLGAFAIQAALMAKGMGFSLPAVIVSALLTGTGGGIIRDLLAQRQPMIFKPTQPLYGVVAMAAAALIGLGWPQTPLALGGLLVLVVTIRMAAEIYQWRLPRRSSFVSKDGPHA